LIQYLEDLIKSGFVSRDFTWQIKTGKSSKLSRYRLSDNYLRFYLKYVSKNREAIIRGNFQLPQLSSMMGLQFENLVLKNRRQIIEELKINLNDIVTDNPYFQRPTATAKGCQIDYLIQTKYNTLFACEIKFSTKPVTLDIISEMKEKLSRLELPKRFSCWPVLIHVNGVADSVGDSDYFARIVDFSELLG
jgi:hypothetical protein